MSHIYEKIVLADSPQLYWACNDAVPLVESTDPYAKIADFGELTVADLTGNGNNVASDGGWHLELTPYGYYSLNLHYGWVRKSGGIGFSSQPSQYTFEYWSYWDLPSGSWQSSPLVRAPFSIGDNNTFGIVADPQRGKYLSHHSQTTGSVQGTDTGVSVHNTARQWIYWAQTWDGSDVRVYKDGVEILEYANASSFVEWNSWYNLGYLFNTGADSHWPGRIMHAAVYETVLSDDQILTHYDTMVNGSFVAEQTYGTPHKVVLGDNFESLTTGSLTKPEVSVFHENITTYNTALPDNYQYRPNHFTNLGFTTARSDSGFTVVNNSIDTSIGQEEGFADELANAGWYQKWTLDRGGVDHVIHNNGWGTGTDKTGYDYPIWTSTWDFRGQSGSDNEWVVRYDGHMNYVNGDSPRDLTKYIPDIQNHEDCIVLITSYSYNHTTGAGAAYKRYVGEVSPGNIVTLENDISGTTSHVFLHVVVVEFIGSNWTVQKVDHTFSSTDTNETELLGTSVSDLSNTFIIGSITFDNATIVSSQKGFNCWIDESELDRVYFRKYTWPSSTSRAKVFVLENPELSVQHFRSEVLGGSQKDLEAWSVSPNIKFVSINEVSDINQVALWGTFDDHDSSSGTEMAFVSYKINDTETVELRRNASSADNNALTPWTLQVVDFSGMTYSTSIGDIDSELWDSGGDFNIATPATPSLAYLTVSDDVGFSWLRYNAVKSRDGEFQVDLSLDSLSGDSDIFLCFRANGLTNYSLKAQGPVNGYYIRKGQYEHTGATPNDSLYYLCRASNGVNKEIGSFSGPADLLTKQRLKVRYVYDEISIKIWNASSSEPDDWTIRYKDPLPVLDPGYVMLTSETRSDVSYTGATPSGYHRDFWNPVEPDWHEATPTHIQSMFGNDNAASRFYVQWQQEISAIGSQFYTLLDSPLDITNPCLEFDFRIMDSELAADGAYAFVGLGDANVSHNPADNVNVLGITFMWDTSLFGARGLRAGLHTGDPGTWFYTSDVPIQMGVTYNAKLWFDSDQELGFFTLNDVRGGTMHQTSAMTGLSLSGVYDRVSIVNPANWSNSWLYETHMEGWISNIKVYDKLGSTPSYSAPSSGGWHLENFSLKINPGERREGRIY